MANDILLKIDFDKEIDGGIVDINYLSPEVNNVSNVIHDILIKNDNLPNLFPLGTKLKNGFKLANQKSKYGIRCGITDNQGNGEFFLTFKSISNQLIDNVTITFDKSNEQFATQAVIDDKGTGIILDKIVIYNDDYKWTIKWKFSAKEHNIFFKKWNKPNYNMIISNMSFEINNKIFDFKSIENINITSQMQPLKTEPYYDMISSIGNCTLKDIDKELLDYANDGVLISDIPIEFFINGYKINSNIINEWGDYNLEKKQLEINIVDKIYYLDLQFNGMQLQKNISAYDVLKYILVPTLFVTENELITALQPNKQIIIKNNLKSTIKEHLENINIEFAFLEKSTLRNSIKHVLQISQLVCYTNNLGQIIFDTARPRITEEEINNPVIVLPKAQLLNWKENIQPNNMYTGIQTELFSILGNTQTNNINIEKILLLNNINDNKSFSYEIILNENQRFNYVLNGVSFSKYIIKIDSSNIIQKLDIMFNSSELFWKLNKDVPSVGLPNELNFTYETFLKFSPIKINSELQNNDIRINDITVQQGMYFINFQNAKSIELYFYIPSKISDSTFNVISAPFYSKYNGILESQSQETSNFIFDIVLSNIETSTQNFNTGNLKLESNNLIQVNTKINGLNILNYISSNIILDYNKYNGIRTATCTVIGSIDYNNKNDFSIIVWNGEQEKPTILKLGMICDFKSNKKDNQGNYLSQSVYNNNTSRLWKITAINTIINKNNRFALELKQVW